jgi:hypothetical protein
MTNISALAARTLALFLLWTGLVLAQKLPWHPKQGEALAGVTRVMLVTPMVRVEKWAARSGWEAEGTADHVRRTICGTMDQILEERQVTVDDYLLCLGESEASLEKRQALSAAALHFRDLVNDWSGPHHTEQKLESFHLGDELEVTKKLEVDALILVTANGILTTKGERAMSAASMGGGPGQGLVLHIGVIRPQTGELVFFTENTIGGDFLKHPERMENSIEKAMTEVFGRSSPSQKDSKQ